VTGKCKEGEKHRDSTPPPGTPPNGPCCHSISDSSGDTFDKKGLRLL
jgi:hypothetical protein